MASPIQSLICATRRLCGLAALLAAAVLGATAAIAAPPPTRAAPWC